MFCRLGFGPCVWGSGEMVPQVCLADRARGTISDRLDGENNRSSVTNLVVSS